jgi:hypothetical protein
MIKPCATPGCHTLTYGEICLGCLQRKARERREAATCTESHGRDESSAEADFAAA